MTHKIIRKDDTAVSPVVAIILMVAITVVLASVLYIWVIQLTPNQDEVENIVAELEQGEGNITSGCLFTLSKGSGPSVEIKDYTFRVGKEGMSLTPLKWTRDGNTSYTIDSKMTSDDGRWWDATETIGFDAPPELRGISDGDTIEVVIKNEGTGQIVYQNDFIYREW